MPDHGQRGFRGGFAAVAAFAALALMPAGALAQGAGDVPNFPE